MITNFEEIKNNCNDLIYERNRLENKIKDLYEENANIKLEKEKHDKEIIATTEQINELKQSLVVQLNTLATDDDIYICQNNYIQCSSFNLQLYFLEKGYMMFKTNAHAQVPKITTREEVLSSIGFKFNFLEINNSMKKLENLYLECEANPEFMRSALIKSFSELKIKELTRQIDSLNLEIQNSHNIIKSINEKYGEIDLKDNFINRLIRKKQLDSQKRKTLHLNIVANLAEEKAIKQNEIQNIENNPNQFSEYINIELSKLKHFLGIYDIVKNTKEQTNLLNKKISDISAEIEDLNKTSNSFSEEIQTISDNLEDNKQKIFNFCKKISLNPTYVTMLYSLENGNYKTNINELIRFYEEYLTLSVSDLIS